MILQFYIALNRKLILMYLILNINYSFNHINRIYATQVEA